MTEVPLMCHAQSLADGIESIGVTITRGTSGEITLTYRVSGETDALEIPARSKPNRIDNLWKTTCFELFTGRFEDENYLEYNFSPSRQWAAYQFASGGTKRGMRFGIDRLLAEPELRAPLRGKRVALLAHPASVTADLTHSLDAIAALSDVQVTAAFGPQHGLRGDKQDNMMESPDFMDPAHNIPVFSLYGEVRRPTADSMETFDVILIDLQDLGCRIYTSITTLLYILEAAAEHGKSVWVLDRPNPAGRPVEGLTLRSGWESFVGAGPMPMRHGLTLGEMGKWFIDHYKIDVDYRVIAMEGYVPDAAPGFGWPTDRLWINPSPNAANVNMARAYAGTVLLEGTTRAVVCEKFGLNQLSTNMCISFVMACIFTPKAQAMTIRRSSHGGCRHSHLRPSGGSIRIMTCGAISHMSMS